MTATRDSLRLAREAVAVSREELALGSGVSVDMIASVEGGRRRPSLATSQRLEHALLRAACARIADVRAAVAAVAALELAAPDDERVETATS